MPGEGEVVIGGKEGDQAEGEAADRLGETEAIEGGPRRGCCWQFWRNLRLLAAGWRPGSAGGRGHGAGAETGGGGSKGSVPPLGSIRHRPLMAQRLQPTPPCSGGRSPAIRERKAWSRARLLSLGSRRTRAESRAHRSWRAVACPWRSLASAARSRSRAASSSARAARCSARSRDPDAS